MILGGNSFLALADNQLKHKMLVLVLNASGRGLRLCQGKSGAPSFMAPEGKQ